MGKIEKKVGRKNVLAHLGRFFLLLVVAFVIELYFNEDFMKFIMSRSFIFDTPSDQLDTDKYYIVDNNIFYGGYASDDEGEYYVTSTYDSDGNFKYIGYYVYEKQCGLADEICEATWDALDNGTDQTLVLRGRGYVYEMSDDEKDYYDEFFNGSGVDEDQRLYMTIVNIPVVKTLSSDIVFWLLVGAVIVGFAIKQLFTLFISPDGKKFRKSLADFSISSEALNKDMENAQTYLGLSYGKNYLMPTNSKAWVVPYNKIVWVYKTVNSTRHMLYGMIPVGTTKTYNITIKAENGEFYSRSMLSDTACDETIQRISNLAPFAFYGYEDQIVDLCNNNFAQAVSMVNERKLYFETTENKEEFV